MKKLIIALIAIAGIFTADTVQAGEGVSYKQYAGVRNTAKTEIITVPAGKFYRTVGLLKKTGTSVYDHTFFIQIGATEYEMNKNTSPSNIVGPATIKVYTATQCDFILIYEIIPNLPE